MKIAIIFLVFFSVACSTPYKANELESGKLELKGSAQNGKIGINDKKQIVIRNEKSAEYELRVQDMVNMHLRDDAESELHMLGLCRRDLADPRLGGSGKVSAMPTTDGMQTVPEMREELGLDEDGNLNIVQEEYFEERLKAERKFEKGLRRITEVAKIQRAECEMKMAEARRKVGLPSERIAGDGYFTKDGTWVQTHRNENSLSDAFEIQAERGELKKQTTPTASAPSNTSAPVYFADPLAGEG